MYQFTSYTFTTDSKNEDFLSAVKQKFELEEIDGVLTNEEDNEHYLLEFLYDDVLKIRKDFPNEEFQIDGVWDTSSSAGELMDFQIRCTKDGFLAKCSEWYTEESRPLYDDYASFCECYEEVRIMPLTEEEFNNWDEDDMYFCLESDCRFVKQVPIIYDMVGYAF